MKTKNLNSNLTFEFVLMNSNIQRMVVFELKLKMVKLIDELMNVQN